jgi:DNA polymerase-3 subunit delta
MIYFFSGDNTFEIKQATNSLVRMFVATHGDLALERLDAEEASIATILDAIASMPFLASHKMVVISNATQKELLEKLAEVETPHSTDVIVLIPKVDKRASYYKSLQKHKGFKLFDISRQPNLSNWVIDTVNDLGGVISSANARHLIERVGSNQMLISKELEKLVLYQPEVTRQSIDLLCEPSPQSTVFELLDAAFAGKQKRAEEIYTEQRVQKVEPHAILGMIVWQLHILALVKTAGDKSADTIAKDAKLNPFVVRKSMNLASKLSFEHIKKLLNHAQELDKRLKTQSIDSDEALMTLLLNLSPS